MIEFFPIETPYSSKDYQIMRNVVNMGIDSNLDAFTKSQFKKSPNFNDKFLWNIHDSELPILYKRLDALYNQTRDEDYELFKDDIMHVSDTSKNAISGELEIAEMIDPYDPMDANQTIDGHPTSGSDLNAIADDTEYEMNESELKELIKKRIAEGLGTLGLSYTPEDKSFERFVASDTSTENTIDDDTTSQELAAENSSDSLMNKHGENLKPEPIIDENNEEKRYEQIVFMQGDDAVETMDILTSEGKDAALEHLRQYHHPGQHIKWILPGHGTADKTYEKDGYIMSWNNFIPYIGLQYDTQYNQVPDQAMDEDSQVIRHLAGQREKIGKVPLGKHAPHSQAAKK